MKIILLLFITLLFNFSLTISYNNTYAYDDGKCSSLVAVTTIPSPTSTCSQACYPYTSGSTSTSTSTNCSATAPTTNPFVGTGIGSALLTIYQGADCVQGNFLK
jgi:hypothetical protein